MSDILPDVGVAFTSTILWIFATGVGILFPWMKDTWSIVTAFDVFLGCSTVGLLFFIFMIEETKGKNQQEIWKKMGIKMKGRNTVDNETYIVSDPEMFNDDHLKLTYKKDDSVRVKNE